jgi:hypothetical protein
MTAALKPSRTRPQPRGRAKSSERRQPERRSPLRVVEPTKPEIKGQPETKGQPKTKNKRVKATGQKESHPQPKRTRPTALPNQAVRQLPTKTPTPPALRLLLYVQRGSLAVTFLLVVAALFVYSTTMYTQQLWSKEYNKLKTMQRSERQMLTAGEMLKNQIIRQAEQPGSGLVPKGPENTIYLAPAPDRPAPPPQTPPTFNKADSPATNLDPLGY